MCLIAAAARRILRPEKLSGLTKGVAGVVCFPFSSAVLIDDHSLFHADTLLLSRVHYSERSNAGEKKKRGGGGLSWEKGAFFMCFTQGQRRKKRGPHFIIRIYICTKKKMRRSHISARLNLSECGGKKKTLV